MMTPDAASDMTIGGRPSPTGSGTAIAMLRNIPETVAGLIAILRERPEYQRARMFLFQLFSVEGAWEKARSQLGILASQSSEAQLLAAAYGQVIDAEMGRASALAGEGAIPLLAGADGWARALAETRFGADLAGLAAAFDAAPDTPGDADGQSFDFLFDGDSRFGPTLEAIVGGRWGLIPFDAIEEIRSEGPVDLRDLVWLPAEIRLRDGPGFAAFLPTRYPGTEREGDEALRLARRTEWREVPGGVHGVGQRVWTTSAGEDVPILSFRRIRFAT